MWNLDCRFVSFHFTLFSKDTILFFSFRTVFCKTVQLLQPVPSKGSDALWTETWITSVCCSSAISSRSDTSMTGNKHQLNSSLQSHRGIDFPPGSPRANLCSKSSGLKCTEHITERFDGSHLPLFYFTKSTISSFFLLASGQSSSKNGIT